MGKSVVGVDIGQRRLRGVEIETSGKSKPTVVRYHEVSLPEGAVRNGEVIETQTVATAMRLLWEEGKFKSKDVVLGLGNQKVLARDLTVPKMSMARIRESLPFQVQDLIPVPVADALLDFYPISEGEGENGPVYNGLLIAAVKQAVLANVDAVLTAGLKPVDVDLIPFALQRAHGTATGTTAIIDIGATTTNIILAVDGVPQFVRIIPAGGDDLTEALMAKLGINRDEAEAIKVNLGIAMGNVPLESRPALEVIYEISRELLNSIRNTLNYFVNTRPEGRVDSIVLTGGGANLRGFSGALGEITKTTVVVLDPFAQVTLSKDVRGIDADARRDAAVAIGLVVGRAA